VATDALSATLQASAAWVAALSAAPREWRHWRQRRVGGGIVGSADSLGNSSGIKIERHHPHPIGSEALHKGPADAAPDAGDNGGAPGKPGSHQSLAPVRWRAAT